MSVIAASRIPAYLSEDMEVRVCFPDGKLWKIYSGLAVVALADRQMIFGIGSPSKLKSVRLTVDPDSAQSEIERHIAANRIKGRLQNAQSSQTVARHSDYNLRAVFRHIRTSAFAPQAREQWV